MTKIRVKLGAAEAEVEADPEHLREAIELIPEVAAKLPRPGKEPPAEPMERPLEAAAEVPEHALTVQFPVVALEKGDSLADVIGKFFAGPWGRQKRKLSDVREALQSYGLNYPKQSVAVALLRLAKTTKLRRFKAEDGEYVYTSAMTLAAPQPMGEPVFGELVPAQQE
ncbi:MAG TPA: hypothetical protein VJR06_01830 [Nitrososphaerales archaeon]|nr:hypothetical protein [Nitrososphaerales archaeon]